MKNSDELEMLEKAMQASRDSLRSAKMALKQNKENIDPETMQKIDVAMKMHDADASTTKDFTEGLLDELNKKLKDNKDASSTG